MFTKKSAKTGSSCFVLAQKCQIVELYRKPPLTFKISKQIAPVGSDIYRDCCVGRSPVFNILMTYHVWVTLTLWGNTSVLFYAFSQFPVFLTSRYKPCSGRSGHMSNSDTHKCSIYFISNCILAGIVYKN